MKTSSLIHPKKDPYAVVSRYGLAYLDGNKVAAALLSFFSHQHDRKLANLDEDLRLGNNVNEWALLQHWTIEELARGCMLIGKSSRTIKDALDLLVERKAISIHSNPNPKFKYDNTRHFMFHPDVVSRWLDKIYAPLSEREKDEMAFGKYASSTNCKKSIRGQSGTGPRIAKNQSVQSSTNCKKSNRAQNSSETRIAKMQLVGQVVSETNHELPFCKDKSLHVHGSSNTVVDSNHVLKSKDSCTTGMKKKKISKRTTGEKTVSVKNTETPRLKKEKKATTKKETTPETEVNEHQQIIVYLCEDSGLNINFTAALAKAVKWCREKAGMDLAETKQWATWISKVKRTSNPRNMTIWSTWKEFQAYKTQMIDENNKAMRRALANSLQLARLVDSDPRVGWEISQEAQRILETGLVTVAEIGSLGEYYKLKSKTPRHNFIVAEIPGFKQWLKDGKPSGGVNNRGKKKPGGGVPPQLSKSKKPSKSIPTWEQIKGETS